MAALPVVSGRDAVKAFQRLGWTVARQSVSHIIMVHPDHNASLSIPDHREVAKGTPRSLIRHANLTVDEFVAAL
jgi:predicted RNA binding protein YcfA (HicA-like mRNA interferase family)